MRRPRRAGERSIAPDGRRANHCHLAGSSAREGSVPKTERTVKAVILRIHEFWACIGSNFGSSRGPHSTLSPMRVSQLFEICDCD